MSHYSSIASGRQRQLKNSRALQQNSDRMATDKISEALQNLQDVLDAQVRKLARNTGSSRMNIIYVQ